MLDELLKSVLVIVVSFLLKAALAAIGVEIDQVLFDTLVTATVGYLLVLLGYEAARKAVPTAFRSRN